MNFVSKIETNLENFCEDFDQRCIDTGWKCDGASVTSFYVYYILRYNILFYAKYTIAWVTWFCVIYFYFYVCSMNV